MKLAKSINRLGTETAFEVLAKAKKLEAQGKEIVHLEIGEPDFDDCFLVSQTRATYLLKFSWLGREV